jgi:NAD(P)-dependent dehydrogenase (short-subunit alcohol dehydrogenase family)
LSKQKLHLKSDSVFLITDDERGIGRALADKLRGTGGSAVLVRARKKAGKASKRIYNADLTDPQAAVELLRNIHRDLGPVDGVIHLLPLKARKSFKQMSFKDWRNRQWMETKSLFYLAKAVSNDLQQSAENGTGFFLAATGMGGSFGIETEALKSFFPNQGGIAGLVKTLAVEWENVRCKVVDFDSVASAATVADQLLAEMAAKNGDVEVGYRNSVRVIPQLASAQFDEDRDVGMSIDSSWVLLVTGGARGITAEVTLELAERYQPTMLLVGRTPLPETDTSPETIGIASAHELKAALIEEMRASGREFTLAQIETRYRQLYREREIRKNIAAMQAAGATVKYFAVDVCDDQAFGDLIEEIYRSHGRLDGIIHAAGIIEDKLTVDKLPESFDRVFDTKVDSAFVLAKKVKADALRFLVFFSSVAGRFGNRGQCDYVAANEVLNKIAVYLDRQWPGRIVAINWGPWAKAGMVTDEVEKQFAQRGVGLIAPAAGRLAFEKELRLGSKGAVEVTIGQVQAEGNQVTSLSAGEDALPFIAERSFSIQNADHFEFVRTLDVKHDLFLNDHQLDGNPVLPMAMALEMMAEVVQKGLPERKIVRIQSLQVLKGIVLNSPTCKIRISARPRAAASHAEGILEIDTEIAELKRPDQPSYRAVVHAGRQFPEPSNYDQGILSQLRPFPLAVDKAYERWLFQGPYFQGISAIDGFNDHGICGLLSPSSPARAFKKDGMGQWLIDPVILDSSLQLAILWERAFYDMTPLPARFACYHRFDSPPDGPVYCYVHTRPSLDGHILTGDFYNVDSSGRVFGILEQMESSCTKDFNRLAEFSKSSKGGN